jgi:Protein of unknown function (DUF2523)
MQGIIDFFYGVVQWVFALVLAVVNTIVAMLQDLIAWVLDQLLAVVVHVLGLFDFEFMHNNTFGDAMNHMPSEVWNIIWLLGLPYCLAMIAAAIGVRLILQLIPFTRLGS